MKKILLFCIMLLAINASDAQNFWKRKANGPGRFGAVSFVIGTKAYVGTGDDSYIYDPLKKDFWEYNPAGPNCGGTWTQLVDFRGTKRREAVAFSIGNKGYVGTGDDGTLTNDFYEYDPIANDWDTITPFPGTARQGAVAFTINGKGYVGTGVDAGGSTTNFYEYNPTLGTGGTWTPKTNFGGGNRAWASAFVINNKGYVGTGGGPSSLTKDFWEYDPILDTFIQKADFGGSARLGTSSFSINGKGYIGVGEADGGAYMKDFWEYDPNTNAWTQRPNYESAQGGNDGVGFSVGSKGYFGEGRYGNGEFWEYSPPIATSYVAPDSWAQKASLGTFAGSDRWDAIAFTIGDKGYVGTGSDRKDFWQYNPANNTWTQKMNFGNDTVGGRYGCVGFSIGNKGYVGLGRGPGGDYGYMNDFWEYDTSANLWTQKAYFLAAVVMKPLALA